MSETIAKLANALGETLNSRNLKVVTAESCTGGGLGFWVTSVAGSSAWYERGFVTYSNQAKQDLLNVSAEILDTHGAVSEQTAIAMAEGALKNSHSDVAIAITGIAGPDGGSEAKPVGTVWIAYAGKDISALAEVDIFPGTREMVRLSVIERALKRALQLID